MKIGVILGSFSVGSRPIDFNNLWDNPRGLTGTDLCFVRVSQELEKLGHQIVRFNGVDHVEIDSSFDCVISINEPNLLIGVPKSVYRLVYMMLNDFSFIKPGFNDWTDCYVGVCQEHTDYVAKNSGTVGKWKTVALGCDPELYKDERVPGRVLWCSSADRGLHWLLQCWPDIKQAVPEASLRILYHFNYGQMDKIEPQDNNHHLHVREMAQRIRYMKHAIDKLKDFGVEHVGSVSRNQMVKEWNQASVFGFPCDTVAFSEGFSVSTLEAHASYTVPVITSQDCLGSIYRNSGCKMIEAPVQQHLPEFTGSVIAGLKDPVLASQVIEKSRQFAEAHTWQKCAQKLDEIIKSR